MKTGNKIDRVHRVNKIDREYRYRVNKIDRVDGFNKMRRRGKKLTQWTNDRITGVEKIDSFMKCKYFYRH